MKIRPAVSAVALLLLSLAAGAERRCLPDGPDEQILRESDFRWNIDLEEIKARAQELYISPKRLIRKAYFKNGNFVIPIDSFGSVRDVRLTSTFIKSVTLHVEEGLKRRYVDAITFSDMGHSHFFIPQKFYDEVLSPIPIPEKHVFYETMLAHEGLKVLYHTAEQLKMTDDAGQLLPNRHTQWRFFTRNLVGDNGGLGKLELLHNEEHRHNTASTYDPDYRYWGGGFYISAHADGCFPFQHNGKTYYFDLNLDGI